MKSLEGVMREVGVGDGWPRKVEVARVSMQPYAKRTPNPCRPQPFSLRRKNSNLPAFDAQTP
jgi:hypothetical protein